MARTSGRSCVLLMVAALVCGSGLLSRAAAAAWRESVTPHFVIRHQSAFAPAGLAIALERIHQRLRLDLSMFTPWMAKERVFVYVYSDAASYYAGEFSPPAWSNGISVFGKKAIVVHEQKDRAKFLEVVAHELTHLFFDSYWAERSAARPPAWLSEGLAMTEEAPARGREDSDWLRALASFPPEKLIPFETLVALTPTDEKDKDLVSRWYAHAYSYVYFLLRTKSRLQFHRLCEALRDGQPLKKALWSSYRYSAPSQLQAAWQEWLRLRFPAASAPRLKTSGPFEGLRR